MQGMQKLYNIEHDKNSLIKKNTQRKTKSSKRYQ